MALKETVEDIELAFQQFEFSIRLLSYCDQQKLAPQDIDDDHLIALPEGDLYYAAGRFADFDRIHRAAWIGVLIAVGVTAISLNRGFELVPLVPDPTSTDEMTRLRTLVYMVRNAYAHDIASPSWEVRGPFLTQLTVNLAHGSQTLDLTTLHGQPFGIGQIGGYIAWDDIQQASVAFLKSKIL